MALLSSLTVATSTSSGDKYYITQSGVDKQIDYDSVEYLGNRIDLSGATALDWSLISPDFFDTLTSNITYTDSNLPQNAKTKIITLTLTGDFAITFPAYWKKVNTGVYDGTKENQIVIICLNGNVGFEQVQYVINPAE